MIRRYALAALFACALALGALLAPLSAYAGGGDQLDRVQLGNMIESYASLQPAPAKAAAKVAAAQPVAAAAPAEPVRVVIEQAPPPPAPAAVSPTVVEIPWGEWLQRTVFPWIWFGITCAFAWAMRTLPGWAVLLVKTYGEQRLLGQIHDIAANMVAGASKNGTAVYSPDVGSRLLATAVKTGMQLSPLAIKLIGGEDALRLKLIGFLHLDPSVAAGDLLTPPAEPAAAAPVAA